MSEKWYIDTRTGKAVFTEEYHLEQGKCCGNACRHCPYGHIRAHSFRRPHWVGNKPTEVTEEPWVWSGKYPRGNGRVCILPYLPGRFLDAEKVIPVLTRLGWHILLAPIVTTKQVAIDQAREVVGFSPIPPI